MLDMKVVPSEIVEGRKKVISVSYDSAVLVNFTNLKETKVEL